MYFVVAQTQFNSVGQEVTNGGTEQVAVVVKVASAIEELFLGKAFDFNSALALSQCIQRRSSDQRADDCAQGVFQFHP
ncbi:hypothetical protein D3C78_1748280 [compost metagenome]